jgi:hypothetical protein
MILVRTSHPCLRVGRHRWIRFSCKCLLYFLPPYSSTSRFYSFIFLYSEFDKRNWRSNHQPTNKQLVVMRWRGINGGPNFINWFQILVQSSCDISPSSYVQTSYDIHEELHVLFSAPKLPTSMMTYGSYPMGV